MKQNKKIILGILVVIIGIILIGIFGVLFLQNNLNENYEKIFFTLQGDDMVSSFPNVYNWTAGEKMTYVSTSKTGLLVLASSSEDNMVFVFNGETGEEISTFQVGETPKGVKIRSDGKFAFVANENSDSITVIDLVLGMIHKEIPIGKNHRTHIHLIVSIITNILRVL